MKKMISSLLILTTLHTYANCQHAYEKASHRRDVRNEIIVLSTYFGTLGAIFFIPTGIGAGVVALANQSLILGVWPATNFKRQGDGFYLNTFDKLLGLFSSAQNKNVNTKSMKKFISSVENKENKKLSLEEKMKVMNLLNEGFEKNIFCSKKNRVFKKRHLVTYISNNL